MLLTVTLFGTAEYSHSQFTSQKEYSVMIFHFSPLNVRILRMWKNCVPAIGVRCCVFYNINETLFALTQKNSDKNENTKTRLFITFLPFIHSSTFFLGSISCNHCLSHFLFLPCSFFFSSYFHLLSLSSLSFLYPIMLKLFYYLLHQRAMSYSLKFFWHILPLLLMIICRIIIDIVLYTDKC